MTNKYKVGDWIVYHKGKFSECPGERARTVSPASEGDTYSYVVDKFWTVIEVREETLIAVTRRGKRHELRIDDPNIRPASWWVRLMHRDRFPPVPKKDETLETVSSEG